MHFDSSMSDDGFVAIWLSVPFQKKEVFYVSKFWPLQSFISPWHLCFFQIIHYWIQFLYKAARGPEYKQYEMCKVWIRRWNLGEVVLFDDADHYAYVSRLYFCPSRLTESKMTFFFPANQLLPPIFFWFMVAI